MSNDSIINVLESKQRIDERLIVNKLRLIEKHKQRINSLESLNAHQYSEISEIKSILEQDEKVVLNYKRKSKMQTVGMVVLLTILIIR